MNEALVTLDDLSIGYDGRPLLSGISFSIERAGFTAVLGANGSGKSTLLKTVLGLLPPVAGRIAFGGRPAPVFGYVPQSVQFDPIYLLTGFDVALMGAYGRVRPGRPVPAQERAFTRSALPLPAPSIFPQSGSPSCRAGRNSGCLSPGRWPPGRTSSFWTSLPQASTRRRPTRCSPSSRRSAGKERWRSFSRRTTSRLCDATPGTSSGSVTARCSRARRGELLPPAGWRRYLKWRA